MPLSSIGKKLLLAAGMLAVTLSFVIGITSVHLIAQTAPDKAAAGQSPGVPDWQTAAGGKMAFEVASVKPTRVLNPPNFPLNTGDAKTPGGRFSASFPLFTYIYFAYKLSPSEGNSVVAQLPKSVSTDSFEIEARGAGNPTKDQMRLMMQSLLADRFKLAVHFESREGPVFALTLVRPGQTGPKLRPHAEGPACPDSFEMFVPFTPIPPRKAGDVFPSMCDTSAQLRGTPDGTLVGSRNTTIGLIADDISSYGSLAGEVDKPVVDQTGLKGRFDFTLELPPRFFNIFPSQAPTNPDAPPPDPQGPRFLNAVREQLGLRLVPSRGAIRTLVIDHVERPSEN
jgi:bla regulator protein blaR1